MRRIPDVADDEKLLKALRHLVSRRCSSWLFILLCGAGLWAPAPSDAQVLSATLRGAVTDTSGATIPRSHDHFVRAVHRAGGADSNILFDRRL